MDSDPHDAESLPLAIDPEEATADVLGEVLSFDVEVAEGAQWTAESLADWLTIADGASGTGNGTISYTADRNSGAELRDGQIKVTPVEESDEWEITTMDSEGNVGSYTSLNFNPSGTPAISYLDATNRDLKYASFDGQDWTTATIDSVGNVGYYTSLSFDPSGNPAISYYDSTNQTLKYASFDGQDWSAETIDSEGDVGYYHLPELWPIREPCHLVF